MSTAARAQRVRLGAEIAPAFLAGAGTFALVAVVLAGIESDVLIVLLGVPFGGAIVAVARIAGVVYAVPIAMAGMLAYDWYYLPPTHALEFPDSANLVGLIVYLAVAVLIGQLAAHAARRARVSEAARTELAEEQAALRRVATLVAQGVPAQELLAAVAEEVGTLLDVDGTRIARYEGEDELVHATGWSKSGFEPPAFDRAKLEGTSVSAEVRRTGRVARIDDYEHIEARAAFARGQKLKSVVGAPIVVDGRRWGVMVAWSSTVALPADAEARLTDFTDLVATAIANTEARREVARLAEEQAALRRMATLVARGVPPPKVFAAVAREVGQLLGVSATHMGRYESDGTVTGVGSWSPDGTHLASGTRTPLDGTSVSGLVFSSGRPARIDSYDDVSGQIAGLLQELKIRSSVGAPIVVDGQLWGVMIASSKEDEPLAADTESRIAAFTELVATAISNAQARADVGRLADEQAALRRVATLVAREPPPAEVFATVAEEVGRLLRVDATAMLRYESDGTATFVAEWSECETHFSVGTTVPIDQKDITARVFSTGQPARLEDPASATGQLAGAAREMGVKSSTASPVIVEGRLWGVMLAMSVQPEPLPPETESRIGEFTELVATAISNIEARSALAASRARIVAATDQTRRRFERDLHDGVQQRLVSLTLETRAAEAMAPPDHPHLRAQLSRVSDGLTGALDDLRELSRGIHPAVLSEGGLEPALNALARRSAVPIELEVSVAERLAERVEVAAYYVVSEALTNAAKHAHASVAEVRVEARNGILDLWIHDDGVGGADPVQGSGLIGLVDRVEALGGTIMIASPVGGGTSLHVELPVEVS